MPSTTRYRWSVALKIFVALLAGAVVPALLVVFVFVGALGRQAGGAGGMSASAGGTAFLVALAFTLAHAFILGLPLVLAGLTLRAIRWWSCILVGFIIGIVPTAWASNWDIADALPMGALGAIGGLVFWLVWHFWKLHEDSAAVPTPAADGSSQSPG